MPPNKTMVDEDDNLREEQESISRFYREADIKNIGIMNETLSVNTPFSFEGKQKTVKEVKVEQNPQNYFNTFEKFAYRIGREIIPKNIRPKSDSEDLISSVWFWVVISFALIFLILIIGMVLYVVNKNKNIINPVNNNPGLINTRNYTDPAGSKENLMYHLPTGDRLF